MNTKNCQKKPRRKLCIKAGTKERHKEQINATNNIDNIIDIMAVKESSKELISINYCILLLCIVKLVICSEYFFERNDKFNQGISYFIDIYTIGLY